MKSESQSSQEIVNGFINNVLQLTKEPIEELIKTSIRDCLRSQIEAIRSEPILKTREETANILRITLPTLKSLEDTGRLIPSRIGDKRVLYDLEDIKEYLKSSKENLPEDSHPSFE